MHLFDTGCQSLVVIYLLKLCVTIGGCRMCRYCVFTASGLVSCSVGVNWAACLLRTLRCEQHHLICEQIVVFFFVHVTLLKIFHSAKHCSNVKRMKLLLHAVA